MLKTYKQLQAHSVFMKEWNGKNSWTYKTSNAKLNKLHTSSKDSMINSVIIKQLAQYDELALEKVLTIGVMVSYQEGQIEMIKKGSRIQVSIHLKALDLKEPFTLSKTSLAKLAKNQIFANHDYLDVLQAICDKVVGY